MGSVRPGWDAALVFGLAAAICLPGCSGSDRPERAAVSGKVTWNGAAVEDGTITFVPTGTTKGQTAGGPIRGGAYSIEAAQGPVLGTHRVEILAVRKTGRKIAAVPPATGDIEQTEQYLPREYNSASTLTGTISKGSNNLDFTLPTK